MNEATNGLALISLNGLSSACVREGIELASLSDAGNERTENQDFFGYFEPEDEPGYCLKGRLAVVSDGMGGHKGGETASRLAVQTVCAEYSKSTEPDTHLALVAAFTRANQTIRDAARGDGRLEGMGATCTAAVLRDGVLHYAHVGDSRLYLIRGEHILQLTHDHSMVAELVHQGIVRPEDAETHPDRHVLLNALGSEELEVEINPDPIPVLPGDCFILCSDGMSSMVSSPEILRSCRQNSALKAAEKMIDLAKGRGGPDNITVQVIRII